MCERVHIVQYYAMGRCGMAWRRFGELLLCGRGDAKHLLAFERGAHRRLCGCTRTLVKRGFVVERVCGREGALWLWQTAHHRLRGEASLGLE